MIFRKRERRGGIPPRVKAEPTEASSCAEFYHIAFDMMVKGAIVKRRSGPVRQFGVTVDGSTRLVTSGDTVDRDTYEALLAMGAIVARLPVSPDEPPQPYRGNPAPDADPEAEG